MTIQEDLILLPHSNLSPLSESMVQTLISQVWSSKHAARLLRSHQPFVLFPPSSFPPFPQTICLSPQANPP